MYWTYQTTSLDDWMENSCHLPPTGFFSARGWISDLLYRPCHGAGHRGRFGWVPLVQCCLSVSWFLMPWRFHVKTTLLASIASCQYSWLFPPQLFWNHSETTFNEPQPAWSGTLPISNLSGGGLQSVFLVRELVRERRPPEQMENEVRLICVFI